MMHHTYLKEDDEGKQSVWTRSDSLVAQIGAQRLEQTSIQVLIVIYSAIIGFLLTFYFWGLIVPYSTLAVLKGIVYLHHFVLRETRLYRKINHYFKI